MIVLLRSLGRSRPCAFPAGAPGTTLLLRLELASWAIGNHVFNNLGGVFTQEMMPLMVLVILCRVVFSRISHCDVIENGFVTAIVAGF